MNNRAMSLKAKIRKYAKDNNIAAQVVLQNYMFERFLERLSLSLYKEKFVVKGGMLISAIVGLDTRTTMDLDTTIRNLTLSEDNIRRILEEIFVIDLKDDVDFKITSIDAIRKVDIYGGYCVKINAILGTITTPLSIDISVGDIITPEPIYYELGGMFDDELIIGLCGYNIETVLAEKVETILSRGIFTTRPRDFYDVYILSTTQKYDKEVFLLALKATSEHRESQDKIKNIDEIIEEIDGSDSLKNQWTKYQGKFVYAKNISYEDTIIALKSIFNIDI